jgi:hypothetical protein
MSQNDLLAKTPEDAARAENARRTLIAYLAGDQPGIEINEAVNTLCKLAPDILLDLRQRLVGEHERAEAVCWEMSEHLDEYLSLGAEAATRLPLVHIHLASCPNCRDQSETLRAVVSEQHESWLAFSQSLSKPKQVLVLTGRSGWQWRGASRSLWRALTEQDVKDEHAVGAWRLAWAPERAFGFKLHEDIKPPLSLSLSLPEDAALIRLHVIHEYVVTMHRDMWRMAVELDPGSRLKSLIVGVGNEQAITKESITLEVGSERTFQIEPSEQDFYWLHFAWPSDAAPGSEWLEYKAQLRLRFDPNGEEV